MYIYICLYIYFSSIATIPKGPKVLIYMYIYAHINTHIYAHTCTQICAHTYTYIYAHTYAYICTYIYTYIHVYKARLLGY